MYWDGFATSTPRLNLSLYEAPEVRSNRNGAWQSRSICRLLGFESVQMWLSLGKDMNRWAAGIRSSWISRCGLHSELDVKRSAKVWKTRLFGACHLFHLVALAQLAKQIPSVRRADISSESTLDACPLSWFEQPLGPGTNWQDMPISCQTSAWIMNHESSCFNGFFLQ